MFHKLKKLRHHTTGRLHSFLTDRVSWYSRWHLHPHHKKVHVGFLTVYIVTVVAVLVSTFTLSGQVFAAGNTWTFGTPTNFTVGDNSQIEVASNAARLKERSYPNDTDTNALWHMDSANANITSDASSNGNDLTIQNNPTFTAGQFGSALSLDGTSKYARASDTPTTSVTGPSTIEGWFNPASNFSAGANKPQTLLDKGSYKTYLDNQTGKLTFEAESASASPNFSRIGGNKINSSWANTLDTTNSVRCSVVMGDSYYVGLGDSPGNAEVWKWNGTVWSKIGGDGLNSSWIDNSYEYVRSLAVYNNKLYAGLGASQGDAEVWRWDVGTWTKVGGDGLGWADNSYEVVANMTTFTYGGTTKLYAGLGVSAGDAELWSYDGSTWVKVGGDGLGWADATYEYVMGLTSDSTYIYAGLGSSAGDGELWRFDGVNWLKIGGDGINSGWGGSPTDATYEYVYSIISFNSKIYAGLGSTVGDGEIWEWNGATWRKVYGDGVGGADLSYYAAYSFAVYNNSLYAGFGGTTGLGNVHKWDGTNWNKVGGGGVNSSWNGAYANYVYTMTVYGTNLLVSPSSSTSYPGYADLWNWNDTAWSQIGGDDINSSWSDIMTERVSATANYGGYLYAGFGDSAGDASVWRYNGQTWQLVGGDQLLNNWPINTYEKVTSMATFNDRLYIGMGTSSSDGDIYSFDDDTNVWTKVGGDALNGSWGAGREVVPTLVPFNNMLCAGLGNSATTDGEVYCYKDLSGTWTWQRFGGGGVKNSWSSAYTINDLQEYNGKLYAAIYGSTSAYAEVWGYNPVSDTWTQIGGDALNSCWPNNTYVGVYSLTVYDDLLVAGLGNNPGDSEVWTFNGTSWAKIGGDGLNQSWQDNTGVVNTLTEYNGKLYAGLGTANAGDAKLWCWDGSTWALVAGDGRNNSWQDATFEGVCALTVWQGKLYAGLGTSADDSEMWVMGNNTLLQSSTNSWLSNQWNHYAIKNDGVTMKLLINGQEQASASAITISDNNQPLFVGNSLGSNSTGVSSNFNGLLDEVRISKVSRSTIFSTKYANTAQTVRPNTAILTNQVKSFDGFSADTTGSAGTITYRLSSDGGTSWKFWNGSTWASSGSNTDANILSDINTHISAFQVGPGGILWQAVLLGDGTQQALINSITVSYTADTTDPVTPSSTLTAKDQKNNSTTDLTTNQWYRYPKPYFTWPVAGDGTGSGVDGYYVYFGTTADANPKTSKGIANELGGSGIRYQTSTGFEVGVDSSIIEAGETYYLRILAKDKSQNPCTVGEGCAVPSNGTPETIFTYNYDNQAPANSSGVAVSPSGWSSSNNFTFYWSTFADLQSNLEAYYYRVKKADNTYYPTDSWMRTTDIQVALNSIATDGTNIFELKAVDNAGNESEVIPTNFYYNASAPTAPTNLKAIPTTNTENNFSFTWEKPVSFGGNESDLSYYYSVNVPPEAGNVNSCGNTNSLPAGPYATKQGNNLMYIVAKDGVGNINYSAFASVNFEAYTAAPGVPRNLSVSDGSIRIANEFRLIVTWSPPITNNIDKYIIKRSIDNKNFLQVGEVNTTGYIDTGLDSTKTYYYKIYTEDNAGSVSAEPQASDIVNKQPTGKYPTPPALVGKPIIVSSNGAVEVSWTTDRDAVSQVAYGVAGEKLSFSSNPEQSGKEHAVSINGLGADKLYTFKVVLMDSNSDLADDSYRQNIEKQYAEEIQYRTPPAPDLQNVSFTDTTTKSTILSFDTTTVATSKIELSSPVGEKITLDDVSEGVKTKHLIRLKDLKSGTIYQVKITITNKEGGAIVSSGHAFSTLPEPTISNLKFEELKEAQTSYKVTWKTNVPTTSTVEYDSDKGDKKEAASGQYVTEHELFVRGLEDQRVYTFQVVSRDQFGNEVKSDANTLTTPLDSRPPKISNLVIEVKSSGFSTTQKAQIVATWETDEPATSQIEYGQGISGKDYPNSSKEDAVLTNNHAVILSELDPSRIYHLRAVSKDKAGNAAYSEDTTTITGKVQNSVLDIIVNSLQRSLGWMFKIFN